MKRFVSYYKPYAAPFAKVLLCALLAAGVSLAFPMCVRFLSEKALAREGDMLSAALICAGVMLVLAVCEALLNYYYDYRGHCLGAAMEADLRAELFSHLETLSFSFYDKRRVGELMSGLTNDLLELSELYHHGPEDYLVNGVRFTGALVFMFAMNWRLALVGCAFVPPMVFLTLRLNKRTRRAADETQARIAEVNARAEEALSGIRETQAFTREEHERTLFRRAGERFMKARRSIYFSESVEYQTLAFFSRCSLLAGAVAGAALAYSSMAEISDVIAYIMYISYLTEPVKHLAWMTTQFQTGLAGFYRVAALLDTQPDIKDAPGARALADPRGDIEFRNVKFRYGQGLSEVFANLSLVIPSGKSVAVVGVSGAGKTTLCSLISRFYEPEAGEILIGGENIGRVTLSSLRGSVSSVRQDTYLFTGSVMENIRYSKPGASDGDVRAAAKNADADGFISALPEGYDTDVGPRGVRLSGGQRQRIAIARAFLRDAPILLLDEATSALDNESERAVKDALDRLRRGRTTVIAAHRLATIKGADSIIVLSEAGLAEQGTHAELISAGGVYSKLYSSDITA